MTRNRISAGLFVVTLLAVFVLVSRVPAAELTPVLFLLTGVAWLCFAVLLWAAVGGSRIGALTERTFIALVIALLGTVSCVIVTNTDQGKPWFDTQTASLLFRLSILSVLFIPAIWLVLYALNKLGGVDQSRPYPHRRVGDTAERLHRRADS